MKSNLLTAALTALTLSATASFASGLASLDDVQGKVLLDQGKGFAAAQELAALNAGDRIFVGDGAEVAVEFDTCILSIADKTVYTVPSASPCALAKDVSEAAEGDFFIEPAAVTAGPQYVYKNGKKYLKKQVIKRYITKKVLKTVKVPVYQTTLVPVGPAAAVPGALGSAFAGANTAGLIVGGLIVAGGVLVIANPVSAP